MNNDFWKSIDYNVIRDFILKTNQNFSLIKLRDYYIDKTQTKLSTYSLRKVLRGYFNLKYSKVRQKYFYVKTRQFIEEKFIFLKLLIKMLRNNIKIIFIDESPFNFSNEKRKGWHNAEDPYSVANMNYGNNFNPKQLILACTFDKEEYYELFTGNNNGDVMVNYLTNLVSKIKQAYGDDLSSFYFFLDSSKINEGSKVYDFFKMNKLKLLYGVNCFSNFDYCEYLFRKIKIKHYSTVYFTE